MYKLEFCVVHLTPLMMPVVLTLSFRMIEVCTLYVTPLSQDQEGGAEYCA